MCEGAAEGHGAVSEALSTMRLRFGEPVRFRFLAGVLSSAGGQSDLLLSGLRFLNAFLRSAPGPQQRVYIQVRTLAATASLGIAKSEMFQGKQGDFFDFFQKFFYVLVYFSIFFG